MKENQVASDYDTVNNLYKSNTKGLVDNSSVMGLAKILELTLLFQGVQDERLDEYITTKAIDGLFTMIGQKKQQFEQNPWTNFFNTKKVFGNRLRFS